MIQVVAFEVEARFFGNAAKPGRLLLGWQARRLFEFSAPPLVVFLRDGLTRCTRGLLNPSAMHHEFADLELRRIALASWPLDRHYLPPFFVCCFPLPFGRPALLAVLPRDLLKPLQAKPFHSRRAL